MGDYDKKATLTPALPSPIQGDLCSFPESLQTTNICRDAFVGVSYCSPALENVLKVNENFNPPEEAPLWSEARPEDLITPASLEEAIRIGYRQRNFTAQDKAIREAEEKAQKASDNYFSLARQSAKYSFANQDLVTAARLLRDTEDRVTLLKKDRQEMTKDLVSFVFASAAQKPVSQTEIEDCFTADTYERVAIGFETVGEKEEASRFYELASRSAETMGTRGGYHLQALS